MHLCIPVTGLKVAILIDPQDPLMIVIMNMGMFHVTFVLLYPWIMIRVV